MKPEINTVYAMASAMLTEIETNVKNVDDALAPHECTAEIADLEFVLHNLEQQLDRVRKVVAERKRVRIRQLCLRWVVESVDGEPIRTDYCILSPSVVDMPRIPTRSKEMEDGSVDYETYLQFCRDLGLTNEETLKHDLFRPHWPGIAEWVVFLATQGKPLPESLKNRSTIADYRITHRTATKGKVLGAGE